MTPATNEIGKTSPLCHFSERWTDAWAFAARVHQTQKMPGSEESYLHHLGMVTFEVISAHLAQPLEDIDLAVHCAILHDSIEDQGVTHAELAQQFGTAVAYGVQALSKNPDLPKAEAMADSLARIRQQPRSVWCVKLADRISNLRNRPPHWTDEKCQRYQEEGKQILAALDTAHPYLAERLSQRIAAYQ